MHVPLPQKLVNIFFALPLSADLSGFLRQRTKAYTHDSYAQSCYSKVRGQNNLKESSVFPSWSL